MLALLNRIVKYDAIHFKDSFCVVLENAVFKKKFGLWDEGRRVRYISLSDRGSSCFVEELDDKFKLIRRVEVQLLETPLPTAICESR